jgi:hypothetical protein
MISGYRLPVFDNWGKLGSPTAHGGLKDLKKISAFRSTLLASGRPRRGLEHASEEYLSPKKQKVKSTYPEVPWKSSISQASQPNFACPKRAKRGEKSI